MATPIWAQEGIALDSTGEMVDDSLAHRTVALQAGMDNVPKFTGDLWYVDGTNGDNGNAGTSPGAAFATITFAISEAAAGDAITVRQGTYAESPDLNLVGLELWGEIGAIIAGTLTVSANSCRVTTLIITGAGGDAIELTANGCVIEDCQITGGVIGLDVNGTQNIMRNLIIAGYTATAVDIAATNNAVYDTLAQGALAGTRGFYLSNTAADECHLSRCTSVANDTAGFEVIAGTQYVAFVDCTSGGADGPRVDLGTNNMWVRWVAHSEKEEHEDVYPALAGEGAASAAITVDNQVTDDSGAGPWDDQWYWGDVVCIVPMSTLAVEWYVRGVYILATTATDEQQFQLMFPQTGYSATRNAGNAWDYQETVLTVTDDAAILAGDKVWITGTGALDGEICDVVSAIANVVTIASETRVSADTGLKYDYTGAEMMYVVWRSGNNFIHGFDATHSSGSAKDFVRYNLGKPKLLPSNAGAIIRLSNATDAAASAFDMRLIYED